MTEPGFYLISPHGAGMQSLLYYFNFLGMPSCNWQWHYRKDYLTPGDYPGGGINGSIYGVTVGRALERKITFGSGRQKVIWLLRDPLSLLCSCINQGIGDSINPFHRTNSMAGLNADTLNRVLGWEADFYVKYASQLNSVVSSGEVMAVDTSELSSARAFDTLSAITRFIGVKEPSPIIKTLLSIPYNNFENRFWRSVPALQVEMAGSKRNIFFCRSYLYDFHFNFWKRRHQFGVLASGGNQYVLFSDTPDVPALDDALSEMLVGKIRIFEAHRENSNRLYAEHKICEEMLVDFLRKHKGHMRQFTDLMKTELTAVRELARDKLAGWAYLHKL